MLSDPQVVTLDTVAVNVPRIAELRNGMTTYLAEEEGLVLQISHDKAAKKANRHVVKITESKDVVQTDGSVEAFLASAHIVFTVPDQGFSAADMINIKTALTDYCNDTVIGDILGFQS
jgi:hypothetical protein